MPPCPFAPSCCLRILSPLVLKMCIPQWTLNHLHRILMLQLVVPSAWIGKAVVSALEDSEQFGRKMVLDQINVLQSLALEQDQLAHREDSLEAGFRAYPHDTVAAESSLPHEAGTQQVLQLEQLAPLPLRMRRRRLQALLSFGAEAHHKEQELLQALVAEQSQLELRAQSMDAHHGKSMLAFPPLPPIASRDGGAMLDIDGFPMVEADVLLKEQASIAALSSREEQLAERLDLLATRSQSHVAKFFFAFSGREPLESLPWHTGFNYLILFLLLAVIFCRGSNWQWFKLVQAGIFSVILFIFAYFLLGRGFPAEIEHPMVIDWCLRVLGCLYAFFMACIVVQICRECFCPPPSDEDGLTGDRGDDGEERPLQGENADSPSLTHNGSSNPPDNDRDRVDENRRALAEAILWRAQPIVLGAILIMLVLSITGLIVYIEGFYVWSTYREESCDQPLAAWLLCTLIFQLASPCVSFVFKQCCNNDELAQLFNNVGFAVLIGIGFAFWENCKLCHETNPYLYHYVQLYLIYNLLIWISFILAGFGLVGLALWMQSMGLASGGQQSAPGLIDKMETIDFQAGMQPEECAICCEKFGADGMVIARTPCGHVFHKDCLGEWLEKFGRTCPLCRKDLKKAMATDVEAPMRDGGNKAHQTKSEQIGMRVHAPADNME